MGFSQGGSLALLMGALQRQRGGAIAAGVPPIKFLWIQSARLPRDPSCEGLFDAPLALPTFVCFNDDDTNVKPREAHELIAKLDAPTVVQRPKGGHAVMNVHQRPADGQALASFLKPLQQQLF